MGIIIGHLISARKSGVLQSQLKMQQEHSAELLRNDQTKAAQQVENLRQNIQKLQDKLDENARLLNEAYTVSASLKAENRNMAEKLKTQKQEIADMHKQFNLEFENIANKIFQQKTETFNKLSAESLSSLLKPFGDNLNEFKHQVAEVYEKESKQRFSLEDRIKELVLLNKQISDDANNLTKALKGDSKMQGNWGEMILETILENSGLHEGEEYFRQEFLKDENGEYLKNEQGQRLQPDVIVVYPERAVSERTSAFGKGPYRRTEQERLLQIQRIGAGLRDDVYPQRTCIRTCTTGRQQPVELCLSEKGGAHESYQSDCSSQTGSRLVETRVSGKEHSGNSETWNCTL